VCTIYNQEDVLAVLRAMKVMVSLSRNVSTGTPMGEAFRIIIITQPSGGCSLGKACDAMGDHVGGGADGRPPYDPDAVILIAVSSVQGSSPETSIVTARVARGPTTAAADAVLASAIGVGDGASYEVVAYDASIDAATTPPPKFNTATVRATKMAVRTAHSSSGGNPPGTPPPRPRNIIAVVVQTREGGSIANKVFIRRAVPLCPHLAHALPIMFDLNKETGVPGPNDRSNGAMRFPCAPTPTAGADRTVIFPHHTALFFDAVGTNS
jgi:hypothetical protein